VTAAQWDGLPQNPERDGWHWLLFRDGSRLCCFWMAAEQGWASADKSQPDYFPEEAAEDHAGCEPCHTPAEVAALVEQARREEREACAAWHDERAAKERASGSITGARAEEYAAAAIRARSAP
jgi:hypothetical protein